MFSKKLAALALFILMLPMIAACGPEPAAAPTATAPQAAEATATTPPAAEATATSPAAAATATSPAGEATPGAGATPGANQAAADNSETRYAAVDCTYGGLLKSVEAVDDTTVRFTMCAPDPAFPSKIAFSSVGIQSAKHLQETGGKPLEDALGTGPYMVQEWVRGDHLTLTANPITGETRPR